jgi:hypothetical protein
MPESEKLTPSDLILLKAMPTHLMEVDGVVRVVVKDPPDEVVRRAVATAFLANEEAGHLRMEIIHRKVFFGLVGKNVLQVGKVDGTARWPTGSLERSLFGFFPSVRVAVSDVVSDWIVVNSTNPDRLVMGRIKEEMAAMGVLELTVVRKSVLKFFHVNQRHFVLPRWTEAVIERQSVSNLIEVCRQSRPDVCRMLHKEIERGFDRRTLSSD